MTVARNHFVGRDDEDEAGEVVVGRTVVSNIHDNYFGPRAPTGAILAVSEPVAAGSLRVTDVVRSASLCNNTAAASIRVDLPHEHNVSAPATSTYPIYGASISIQGNRIGHGGTRGDLDLRVARNTHVQAVGNFLSGDMFVQAYDGSLFAGASLLVTGNITADLIFGGLPHGVADVANIHGTGTANFVSVSNATGGYHGS